MSGSDHDLARSQASVKASVSLDFLELAGTEPATGLIILNRRRTRQAECRHLLGYAIQMGALSKCHLGCAVAGNLQLGRASRLREDERHREPKHLQQTGLARTLALNGHIGTCTRATTFVQQMHTSSLPHALDRGPGPNARM
jgi:hypothetical protein